MAAASILDQNGKMRMEMEMENGVVVIRPIGVIDEDVNFSVIVDHFKGMQASERSLRLDLAYVSRMNSCGVREWILFLDKIAPVISSLVFTRVCEPMVEQANMTSGIFGKTRGAVQSFQAPYHCDSCGRDVMEIIKPSQVTFQGEEPIPPEVHCEKCSRPMTFAWIAKEYFSFVKRCG